MMTTRPFIRVSWERAQDSQVDVDRPSPTFVGKNSQESLLLRVARPVLTSLSAELANEPACVILADNRGVVLRRESGDKSLIKDLDKVNLVPGFSYSESEVGTNGIGTALEMGAPVQVDGRDHYAGMLKDFSCAGALITHPTTGSVLGLIDITTAARNSNPMLLAVARMTARRIQERVLEMANELDSALLSSYYAACQHSEGTVLAVNKDLFMMNALVERHFDANDQAALLRHAREAIDKLTPGTIIADLPSGTSARLSYRPVLAEGALAGEIIQVTRVGAPSTRELDIRPLIGLVGTSVVWRQVGQTVADTAARNEWVVLRGEPGTGKLALLTAVHGANSPMRRLSVVDAAEDGEDLVEHVAAELDSGTDVVIRRGHLLSDVQLRGLAEVFQDLEDKALSQAPWVALTTHEDQDETPDLMHLLQFFPRTVNVPPLRHHIEDLPELVRLLLNRAGASNLILSRQAIHQLMRLSWPQNVTHLSRILNSILRTRRSGVVEVDDLPAECLAVTSRKLSTLEGLERDAIAAALREFQGDKTSAAESLGMSRATIYRKIRQYGIVSPQ